MDDRTKRDLWKIAIGLAAESLDCIATENQRTEQDNTKKAAWGMVKVIAQDAKNRPGDYYDEGQSILEELVPAPTKRKQKRSR